MLNFCIFTFIFYALSAIIKMLFFNNGNGARSFAAPVHNQPSRGQKRVVENHLESARRPAGTKPQCKVYELPRRRYRNCA